MIGTLLFRKKGWRAPSDSGELWVVEPFAQQMHGRPVVIGHPWVGLPKFDILIYIYIIFMYFPCSIRNIVCILNICFSNKC